MKKKSRKEQMTCGHCKFAEPVYEHWNLDYNNHAPICLRCPFVKKRLMIRSEKACDKFKEK